MTARDGPELWSHDATIAPGSNDVLPPKNATESHNLVTRHERPASRLISTPKARTDTGIRKARKPAAKRGARPPKTAGYTWRKDGAGWELRKSVYVETDTGIRKRRLPYVAHLSKSAFGELKRRHKGAALDRAIAEWIKEHDQ